VHSSFDDEVSCYLDAAARQLVKAALLGKEQNGSSFWKALAVACAAYDTPALRKPKVQEAPLPAVARSSLLNCKPVED
jgi:hypothetical protein